MPWKPRIDAVQLKRKNDELAARLLRAKDELQAAERRRVGLEIALSVRGETIAELNGKLDRLRAQNRKLDLEAERLVDMIRFAPQLDAAMAAK
jgi:uncharacterized coiled-coil protein SlyX